MALQVIEGTWEELERHKAEFVGHLLRLTIKPKRTMTGKPSASAPKPPATAQPKELRGYGMLKGVLSTEDYFREKREDTIREDRLL